MIFKYRISWGIEIEKIKIIKESEKSVWTEYGRRELKWSEWRKYFDTFEEAKNHLIKKYKRKIESDEMSLMENKSYLEKIKQLTEEKKDD